MPRYIILIVAVFLLAGSIWFAWHPQTAPPVQIPAAISTTTEAVATSTEKAATPTLPTKIVPQTSPVSVIPPPVSNSEPIFDASKNTVLWSDDFNEYNSDAELLKSYVTLLGQDIHLDNGAVRFDWTRATSTDCEDDSHILEHNFMPTTDLYIQFDVRYQPGFIFDWNYSGQSPCLGNAKKLFLVWSINGPSRFDFIAENHFLGIGSDYDHPLYAQNVGQAMSLSELADGNWHRFTFHVHQSSTASSTDGFIEGWIDGQLRWSIQNWVSESSGGYYDFKVPATFNQGSPANQSEWLDNLKLWR